ncbi:capsular exopolysaccharide family [Pedobacter steynii]|uniref:non-specific protein-tyrosine kinase n=1 Tax=Pedobacter steynii TaxID=430522 RepID=A0A1G9YCF1_9SPHI|nr:tyrosine-protein kinase [Pedobacter steynii]NQX39663.1 polysaccharide biosynthesis tyrosine autokinase [Pedobacter steynii]SDN06326.1 capsular exopolysaccharide family [Pedobacter steynii]
MKNTISEYKTAHEDTEGLDLKQILSRILANWYWIALSVLVCLACANLYVRYKTPSYKISARVLVNDEKKGAGLSGGGDLLGDLGGLLGTKSTVDNEAEILKTRYLMEQVVKDMNLNITYYRKGRLKKVELYESPYRVKVVAAADTIKATDVEVSFLKNDRVAVSADGIDTLVALDRSFTIPFVGVVQIIKGTAVPVLEEKYSFNIMSVDTKVIALMDAITVEVKNKQVTIIDLSLTHAIPKKGEDILNKLIEKYVQANLTDKNEVADSTVKFIQNRLAYIGGELGGLEGNIQNFKQENNLADMTEQSKLLVQTTGQYVNDLGKIETQISILKSLQDYLKDEGKNKRVLPSSLIPADLVFNGAVEKYNSLTLERARRLIGVTEANPGIQLMDKEIANARADIESNISTTLDGFLITRNRINGQMKKAEGQVRNVPKVERNYLNLARQQQIKQELYIFLMQKSEETAISKTSNIANSKTIDPPKSEVKPFSPKRMVVYLFGLVAGLVIPLGLMYVKDLLNDKIQTKEDIMRITQVPIIGEISHDEGNDNMVVANSSRSAISEQFRALRTNLSFFFKNSDEKVILLTSSMSGEGKSFVAINLGQILALTNKKVLLMELDLRKPGLSAKLEISNPIGFTNYVTSPELTSGDIVKPLKIQENLFVVSSGPIPPNPAELLLSERTKTLMQELKQQFDYIIIDAPPVGIVTDAQLLASYADVCLYLVRQNYTLKQQLNIVDGLSGSQKMKGLSIVVNDIKATKGYGYGYSYGNYDVTGKELGFFSKLFKRNK